MGCSRARSSVHGIFQSRIWEWVVKTSSRELPNPRIELRSPVSPALAGRFFTTVLPGKPKFMKKSIQIYKLWLVISSEVGGSLIQPVCLWEM